MSKKAENIKGDWNGPIKSGMNVVITKFILAISFLLPVLFTQNLDKGILISLLWGGILLISSSIYLFILRKEKIFINAFKYICLSIIIIFSTHYSGLLINNKIKI